MCRSGFSRSGPPAARTCQRSKRHRPGRPYGKSKAAGRWPQHSQFQTPTCGHWSGPSTAMPTREPCIAIRSVKQLECMAEVQKSVLRRYPQCHGARICIRKRLGDSIIQYEFENTAVLGACTRVRVHGYPRTGVPVCTSCVRFFSKTTRY